MKLTDALAVSKVLVEDDNPDDQIRGNLYGFCAIHPIEDGQDILIVSGELNAMVGFYALKGKHINATTFIQQNYYAGTTLEDIREGLSMIQLEPIFHDEGWKGYFGFDHAKFVENMAREARIRMQSDPLGRIIADIFEGTNIRVIRLDPENEQKHD